jgi:hypothetical protein
MQLSMVQHTPNWPLAVLAHCGALERREKPGTDRGINMARNELEDFVKAHKITLDARFIPWSMSRNAGNDNPSLNWKFDLLIDGRTIIRDLDYSAGCGHCKSYKQGDRSIFQSNNVEHECETGKHHGYTHKLDVVDVLYSLGSDADVLNYSSFEDWADAIGYDTDSRKAEKMYHECLKIALALRGSIGDAGLTELAEASADY